MTLYTGHYSSYSGIQLNVHAFFCSFYNQRTSDIRNNIISVLGYFFGYFVRIGGTKKNYFFGLIYLWAVASGAPVKLCVLAQGFWTEPVIHGRLESRTHGGQPGCLGCRLAFIWRCSALVLCLNTTIYPIQCIIL